MSDSATPYSQSRDRTAAPRRPARPTVATWGAWWRRQAALAAGGPGVGLRRNVGARQRQERAAETTSHPSPHIRRPMLGLEVAGTRAIVGHGRTIDRGPRPNSPRNRPLRWRARAQDDPDDGSLRDGRGASQPPAMPGPRRGAGPGDAPGAEPSGDAGGLRRRARPASRLRALHGQSSGARLA